MMVASLLGAPSASGATIGNDNLRTGWYPNQSALAPGLVAGSTFGQLFSTTVTGQVYAQPLLSNGTLFVATEDDWIYGLDPVSGAVRWSRNVGTPFNPADVSCGDLVPHIGITGTPVIDPSTGVAYFAAKSYVSGSSGATQWLLHAVDVTSGSEQAGFPLALGGAADNNAATTFTPTTQMQRPGLLLLGGVVYVAFGSHCDHGPWAGWVFGVTTAGRVAARWVDVSQPSGGGIWQAGNGLMSDGAGRILFTSGNGHSPTTPTGGSTPPANLGESAVRLAVQADGSLHAADFFTPYDAADLDNYDADFGSGGILGLPQPQFGTSAFPHLAVAVGKQGFVYLLNRDDLGGFAQGAGGGDAVLQRLGTYGGVWSAPAVWPGNGGYVWVPTASGGGLGGATSGLLRVYRYATDGAGNPALSLAASSSDPFGFGSSAPVVTSDSTLSGSAIVWIVWSPDGTGKGAQLRAYDAAPQASQPTLLFSAPIGTSSKFALPGVGTNRIYVGTRDGKVLGFGSPVDPALTGDGLDFGPATLGSSAKQSVAITATRSVTLTSLAISNASTSPFHLDSSAPSLPMTLTAGQKVDIPITFTPTAVGIVGGALAATTTDSSGSSTTSFTLNGTGRSASAYLAPSPAVLTFPGVRSGGSESGTITITNSGATAATITGLTGPAAPFQVRGLPAVGSTIAPGASLTVTVQFSPTAGGSFSDALAIQTDAPFPSGGTVTVGIDGTASSAQQLGLAPTTVTFGDVALGATATRSFTVTNSGGSLLTVTKSKPPATGPFTGDIAALPEGSTIAPGDSRTVSVTFAPKQVGAVGDSWVINGDDGLGVRSVTFYGRGVVPAPPAGGWSRNGSASLLSSGVLRLTQLKANTAGSSFWPVAMPSANLSVSFDVLQSGGSGGDGTTLVFGDPSAGATSSALGYSAGALGFGGIPGIAVALDTHKDATDPSANFVGISDRLAPGKTNALHWLATTTSVPPLGSTTRHVRVIAQGGQLRVAVDGTQVLATTVTLPPNVLIGFTAANGSKTNYHDVSAVSVAAAPTSVPAPSLSGWTLNGNAAMNGSELDLTQPVNDQVGSAFWPTAVDTAHVRIDFDATIAKGTGADGLTAAFIDPIRGGVPTSIGNGGGGLGFATLPGVGVALDTYPSATNASSNSAGIVQGPGPTNDALQWLAIATSIPDLRAKPHHVTVVADQGTVTVSIDGAQVLSKQIWLPARALVGFTAANGGLNDLHAVSNAAVSIG